MSTSLFESIANDLISVAVVVIFVLIVYAGFAHKKVGEIISEIKAWFKGEEE